MSVATSSMHLSLHIWRVMKMGTIAPRPGFKPTFLAIQGQAFPKQYTTYAPSLMQSAYPGYLAPCLRGQSIHITALVVASMELQVF